MDAPTRFNNIYGRSPDVLAAAPGRINIIGEHTDYNLGFVLPAAIQLKISCLAALRQDNKIVVWSENFGEKEEFVIDTLSASQSKKWTDYIKGIVWVLQQEGLSLKGFDALIVGDIPLESGLSSSAALETCVIFALDSLFRFSLSKEKMACLAQRAENDFVGVECGLMDQFISAFGQKDSALFLDCATLEFEHVPFHLDKRNLKILVYDSRVRRQLASSEYNLRRQEAEAALDILNQEGINNFREASIPLLEQKSEKLGDVLFRRAKHVVTENQRVVQAVRALRKGDFRKLGQILFQSHASLRNDYEVSCPELDLLYKVGKEFPGCLGARLTGAGFGGSGIALIERERIEAFQQKILQEAKHRLETIPVFHEISIGEGAVVSNLRSI